MKTLSILAALALVLASAGAVAQPGASTGPRVVAKVKQLDVLNQVLPLVLTAEQIKALLPSIEKARAEERKMAKSESDELAPMESRVDAAIAAAKERGEVPTRELQKDLQQLFGDFRVRRAALIVEQTDAVLEVVKKVLDAGQVKAAAGALDPKLAIPFGKRLEDVTEADKLRTYVRLVLLDSAAYDILVELSTRTDDRVRT